MKNKRLPNRLQLLSFFEYNEKTGELLKRSTGKKVGWADDKGYIRVRFQGKVYCAHRIIYKMFHGKDPQSKVIDHCDGDTSNNRIENLRCVTHAVNITNQARCRPRRGIPLGDKKDKEDYFYDLVTGQIENPDF